MTFRHLATVVEIAEWSVLAGLEDVSVDDGGSATVVVKGCVGLVVPRGGAVSGTSIKGKTD